MNKYGHWETTLNLDPENYFGFVYLITNLKTGKGYIGKKQYYSYKKSKRVKEMPWRSYTGSSKALNADIKEYGKGNFSFVILHQCVSRGALTYTEANLQHKMDVLTERLEGTDERAYYNSQIGAIRYVPKLCDLLKGETND